MADLNNGATINSLETYFSHIQTLKNLTKNQDETYGRKYTILPIQEEYFEINANSRIITVPEVFRKNGLSVQGDQVAETIYFRINRYFDAMDLNNTKIYIQWENANGEKGFAKEWVRDIETYDDYMVFGWALGGLITNAPGILKFSVRFIRADEDTKNITYSLSTLTAQALINSGLNFSLDEYVLDDTLNNILAGNFINTTTITDSEIKVFKYVYNFDNLILKDSEGNPTNLNTDAKIISADLNENGELELLVSAYADKGTLSYKLYKQIGTQPDPNGTDANSNKDMILDYKITTDTHVQFEKTYFKKVGNDYIIATLEEMGGENASLNGKIFYEKYGKYILSDSNRIKNGEKITGEYYTTAICTTPDNTTSSPLISQYKVLLSPPGKATFNEKGEIGGKEVNTILTPEANIPSNNQAEYIWSMKRYGEENYTTIEGGATLTPTEEANYMVKIKTTRNLDTQISDDFVNYCVTVAPVEDDIVIEDLAGSYAPGTVRVRATYTPRNPIATYGLSYKWFKKDAEENFIELSGETENNINAEAGIYKCQITATYNGLSVSTEREIIVD